MSEGRRDENVTIRREGGREGGNEGNEDKWRNIYISQLLPKQIDVTKCNMTLSKAIYYAYN